MHELVVTALEGKPAAYFAPTYKMMSDVWRELVYLTRPVAKGVNVQEKRIELITGGVIDFWSLDGPDPARGRKYALVVLDECAVVAKLEEAWNEAIRPTLTDYRGSAWFISTPKGHDYFENLWQKGQRKENGEWQSWKMPTAANPYIKPEELAAAKADLPERVYAQEYEADFVSGVDSFVPLEWWQSCYMPALPEMEPYEAVVAGMDAATSSDSFAIVAVSRRRDILYVRHASVFYPPPGGTLDFSGPEAAIRKLKERYPYLAVITYDPYQLHDMATRLQHQGVGSFWDFNQGAQRLLADKRLFDLIRDRRIFHSGDPELTKHVTNANAKTEGEKLRIIKRSENAKIDACVALSMAAHIAMELNIG